MTRPQFQKRPCRPREHLVEAAKLYPHAWRQVDRLRELRGAGVPEWADWCYIPIAGTQAIVAEDAGIDVMMLSTIYPARVADAARLAALAAWRVTQGIYRFDPAVYDAVRETPVSGDVPADILYRLPEWCLYVETPGMQIDGEQLHGFFAHLEDDGKAKRTELRLLLDTETRLEPAVLHLGTWPLAESIERMRAEAERQAALRGLAMPSLDGTVEIVRPVVEPIVSLMLFLCSQAQEIGDGTRRPANPRPKRVRGEWRLFPADRATTWDVGVRLGAALRRAYQAEETGAGGTHAGPRPHIRRAHWHTYWSGPRDGARRADLRWMPPIAVGVDEVDQLPAVVRPVR